MQIEYKKTPGWQWVFSWFCTFGVIHLIKRRTMRLRLCSIDETGIELTNGIRFAWHQFKAVHNPLARIEDAEAERLVLYVDNLTIPVNFDQMLEGMTVRESFWNHWPAEVRPGEKDLPTKISQEGS